MTTKCLEHATNLDTIIRAAQAGDLALVEVLEKATGQIRAALCAVWIEGNECHIVPFALMVDGDPYELLLPPNPDGGFMDSKTEGMTPQ